MKTDFNHSALYRMSFLDGTGKSVPFFLTSLADTGIKQTTWQLCGIEGEEPEPSKVKHPYSSSRQHGRCVELKVKNQNPQRLSIPIYSVR